MNNVKRLRDKTGCGLMECQKALNKSEGDILLAEGWLRYNGLAVRIQMPGYTDAEAYEKWVWDKAKAWANVSEERKGQNE